MRELMQGERGLHCLLAALHILRRVDRFFRQLQRKQRLLGNLCSHFKSGGLQFFFRHNLVDHTKLFRFLCREKIRGEQHFLGLAHPDFPGVLEEFDAADAEAHDRVAKLGVVTGDDNVTGPDQHETAGDTATLHGSDGRLGDVTPTFAKADIDFFLPRHLRFGTGTRESAPRPDRSELGHLLVRILLTQIVTRREMRSVGGEDNDFDIVILRGEIEGIVQFIKQAGILRVARLRAIEDDTGDVLSRRLIQNGLELFHGDSLLWANIARYSTPLYLTRQSSYERGMETLRGNLRKMIVADEQPVSYTLPLSDERLPLNPLLGKLLRLAYSGQIQCVGCGQLTKKSFNRGFCFRCFSTLAQCDLCIVKPELCHFAKGTCREPEWGQTHCMQPHYVY